jgi:hypothetical protein
MTWENQGKLPLAIKRFPPIERRRGEAFISPPFPDNIKKVHFGLD